MLSKLLFLGAAVVLVGILPVALVVFVRARNTSASAPCINNLRQLDSFKLQWSLESNKTTNVVVTWEDLHPYLPNSVREAGQDRLVCPQGGTYILGRLDESPKCSLGGPGHTLPR